MFDRISHERIRCVPMKRWAAGCSTQHHRIRLRAKFSTHKFLQRHKLFFGWKHFRNRFHLQRSSSIDCVNHSLFFFLSFYFFLVLSPNADQPFSGADSNCSASTKSIVSCKVCGDKASGYHYGVTSCEGCKVSFHAAHFIRHQSTRRWGIMNWFLHLTFSTGFLSAQHSKANRISLFARWKMLSDSFESKSMPILSVQKMLGRRNESRL